MGNLSYFARMTNKKVLIITYYWPPSGGSGVQRWLKISKYLHRHNWTPIIYTPENPEAPAVDQTLVNEVQDHVVVIKKKIWEPYTLYKKLKGNKEANHANYLSSSSKKGFIQKLSEWVRANMMIPDPRKFWIKPSASFLSNYVIEQNIDAIISTGPPHSMHLIAQKVKEKTGIPWIADFRDPWTFIDFFYLLPLSQKSLKKHEKLERKVLSTADIRVTVSPNWKKEFEKRYQKPFEVIYNGFDRADFHEEAPPLDTRFTICHLTLNKTRFHISNDDVIFVRGITSLPVRLHVI
jgi:glycosyltransferase involved in cell wall biosynthesis